MTRLRVAVLLAFVASGAFGHGLSPSLLEIEETEAGHVEVRWKTPAKQLLGVELRPVLPEGCRSVGSSSATYEEPYVLTRWSADCGARGLVGRSLRIDGLAESKTDVLVRVGLADGRRRHGVLSARQPELSIPEREPWQRVFSSYVGLGIEHILLGFDHLLFVLGLLLLVRGRRLLVATITAFTVGHSITLSLVALGAATLPSAPIEAAIAASIFVLAAELARPETARPTLMRRRPWAMAGTFGLLHGSGFAGALAEVGLPETDVPLALVGFNTGIEIGQLAFVGVVLTVAYAARRRLSELPPWCTAVLVYFIGTLAAFWTIERLSLVL